MRLVVDKFDALKDEEMRAFAAWVNELATAGAGIQFILSENPDRKCEQVEIRAIGKS
jgi:hypothetical protein